MSEDKNRPEPNKDNSKVSKFGQSRGWRPLADPTVTGPRKPPSNPASSSSSNSNDSK